MENAEKCGLTDNIRLCLEYLEALSCMIKLDYNPAKPSCNISGKIPLAIQDLDRIEKELNTPSQPEAEKGACILKINGGCLQECIGGYSKCFSYKPAPFATKEEALKQKCQEVGCKSDAVIGLTTPIHYVCQMHYDAIKFVNR